MWTICTGCLSPFLSKSCTPFEQANKCPTSLELFISSFDFQVTIHCNILPWDNTVKDNEIHYQVLTIGSFITQPQGYIGYSHHISISYTWTRWDIILYAPHDLKLHRINTMLTTSTLIINLVLGQRYLGEKQIWLLSCRRGNYSILKYRAKFQCSTYARRQGAKSWNLRWMYQQLALTYLKEYD